MVTSADGASFLVQALDASYRLSMVTSADGDSFIVQAFDASATGNIAVPINRPSWL
jgi:hypothetical protein